MSHAFHYFCIPMFTHHHGCCQVPFFCMVHNVVTGFGIPKKYELLSKTEFCLLFFQNGVFSTASSLFHSEKKQMSHIA